MELLKEVILHLPAGRVRAGVVISQLFGAWDSGPFFFLKEE